MLPACTLHTKFYRSVRVSAHVVGRCCAVGSVTLRTDTVALFDQNYLLNEQNLIGRSWSAIRKVPGSNFDPGCCRTVVCFILATSQTLPVNVDTNARSRHWHESGLWCFPEFYCGGYSLTAY